MYPLPAQQQNKTNKKTPTKTKFEYIIPNVVVQRKPHNACDQDSAKGLQC
jgi:hypothetical protein